MQGGITTFYKNDNSVNLLWKASKVQGLVSMFYLFEVVETLHERRD